MKSVRDTSAWNTVDYRRGKAKTRRCPHGITNIQEVVTRAGVTGGRIDAVMKQARECTTLDALRVCLIRLECEEKEVDAALRFATLANNCTKVRKPKVKVDLDSPTWRSPIGGREQLQLEEEPHTIDVQTYIAKRWSGDLVDHTGAPAEG